MALADFDAETLNKLRALLGSFGNDKVSSLLKRSTTYIESQFFEVTEEVTVTEGEDETTEYKAKEVLVDGSEVSIGVTFDSDATGTGKVDETIYLPNLKFPAKFTGEVEVGKIYQVEAVEPSDFDGQTQYYIVPKGGGGSTFYRLLIKNGASLGYNNPIINSADIINNLDEIIEEDVTIIQRKFSEALIYANEIMLAEKSSTPSGDVVYDLSISMSGIGVGEWSE